MIMIPIQNVAFDDTATSAMGEAFDRDCKSLQCRNFSAFEMPVPGRQSRIFYSEGN